MYNQQSVTFGTIILFKYFKSKLLFPIDVALLQQHRSFFESASSRTSYDNAVIRLSTTTTTTRDSSFEKKESSEQYPITTQILQRGDWKAAKHLSSLSEVSQELKKNLMATPRTAKAPVYVVEAAARDLALKDGEKLVAELQQTVTALAQQC